MDRFPTNPRTMDEVGAALRKLEQAVAKILRFSGDVLVDTQAEDPPAAADRGIVLRADDGQYVRVTAVNVSPGVYSLYATEIGTTRP
ncbi:MAG: hypothetical protein AB7I42_24250 [Bradyrhizobium sp.]|uniref:hypothetical protein n=1 Tax=Bradyrhizobium sp. TaxID=376 RepID=UPI003D115AD5